MDGITKIFLAITGVALVATVVVNGVNSAKVINSVGSAYSNSISAATKG